MPHALRNTALAIATFAAFVALGQAVIKPGLQRLGWAAHHPAAASSTTPPALVAELARQAEQRLRPATGQGAAAGRLGSAANTPIGNTAAAGLRTALLIDGVAGPVNASQPVALPDGSRFRLQLRGGAEPVMVAVYAVAPDGHEADTPLWQAVLAAHGVAESPPLRLTGQTGMETLRVQRRALGDGSISEERVRLLHH